MARLCRPLHDIHKLVSMGALGGNSLAMLSPLFSLYLVLGDTSGKAVQCTKGLRLPISEVFV